mgnify:FL=1
MLSDEETQEIKEKILSHIESSFPAEQIANAKQQIELMNSKQLESFLEKNKMVKANESGTDSDNDCVFCSIVSGKINSVKIDDDDDAIAVLEINPISKGHTIVIPKGHSDKSSKKALVLAKKISKKLKKKFSPKKVELSASKLFGHEVINILPVYNRENMDSKRNSAKIEKNEKIKEELGKEKKIEKIQKKPKIEEIKQFFWLPKRIP